MSETQRLLRSVGCRTRRRRRRAQARLPQARDGASPRPQPGRQGGGGAVQGGVGGVPGALRSREARALRPLRPRRSGRAASAAGFHDVGDIFSAFSDIFGDIFGGGGRAAAARAPARGADIEVRLSMTLRGGGHRRQPRSQGPAARRRARTCGGTGAAAGTAAGDLPALRRPRPGDALAGLPDDLHDLPGLPRRGAGRAQAVRRLRRHRARPPGGDAAGRIPAGVEDGSTLRLVGRGEAAPRGGRAGQPLRHPARRGRRAVRARRRRPAHRGRGQLSAARARRHGRGPDARRRRPRSRFPPGTQPGETLALRGRGMPRIDGRGKGDVVAHLKLVVPSSLSAEEEAAPARLRRGGRPARQPRARRLLQAQEEEVARARPRARDRCFADGGAARYHLEA